MRWKLPTGPLVDYFVVMCHVGPQREPVNYFWLQSMPAPTPVSIRMPPELKSALAELAGAERRSLSGYVLLVLEEHVRSRQEEAGAKPSGRKRRASTAS